MEEAHRWCPYREREEGYREAAKHVEVTVNNEEKSSSISLVLFQPIEPDFISEGQEVIIIQYG